MRSLRVLRAVALIGLLVCVDLAMALAMRDLVVLTSAGPAPRDPIAAVAGLLRTGSAVALGLALAWLSLITVVATWDSLRDHRTPRGALLAAPVTVRVLVAVVIGIGMGTQGTTASGAPHERVDPRPLPGASLDGLSLPEAPAAHPSAPGPWPARPSARSPSPTHPSAPGLAAPGLAAPGLAAPGLAAPRQAAPGPGHCEPADPGTPCVHLVRSGDTLWALAREHLHPTGSTPTAAEIDHAWRGIYRLNRGVIGPNPHLVLPGQRLLLPATTTLEETS